MICGFNGKDVSVAIIDTNIDVNAFQIPNVTYVDNENKGDIESHGSTVLASFIQTTPNANILYYPSNKKDSQRAKHLIEHIYNAVKSGVQIISLSASLKNIVGENEFKRINEFLLKNGVTLIDADIFYENFSYCYRNISNDGEEETIRESFCEPEDIEFENFWKNKKDILNQLMSEHRVDTIEELKKHLNYEMLQLVQEFEQILKYDSFYAGENSPLHLLKQRAMDRERKRKIITKSIEIPCAGRTLNKKYWGSSCASYTIPVVAGLFSICKQIDPYITYEEFVNFCRETSKQINGRYLIQPDELVKKVKEIFQNKAIQSVKSNASIIASTKVESLVLQKTESKDG